MRFDLGLAFGGAGSVRMLLKIDQFPGTARLSVAHTALIMAFDSRI